jgi:hypothetical protein
MSDVSRHVTGVCILNGGLPVVLIGDDPSHIHVIVASGCPPVMSHVRITVELSFIGPDGVCIIEVDMLLVYAY